VSVRRVGFTLLPDYWKDGHKLIAETAAAYSGVSRAYVNSADSEKIILFDRAGFQEETRLKKYYGENDLIVYRRTS